MKFGLLANSNLWLLPFYEELLGNHEVVWATYEKKVFDRLKNYGIKDVAFIEDPLNYMPEKVGNKYQYSSPGITEQMLDDLVRPDVWITDVSNRLSMTKKRAFCVQAFHSFPYKKLTFHDSLNFYDLLLLPGEYHRQEFINRMEYNQNDDRLFVSGFPKLDSLHKIKNSKAEIFKKYNLDCNWPVVLYAPTWGGHVSNLSWGHNFWPRWSSSDPVSILHKFLESMHESKIQVIIKMHHIASFERKNEISALVKKFGAFWVDDDPSLGSDPHDFIFVADLLISDMSGIIFEYLSLNKPVVFIEPEDNNAWLEASIPSELRPGPVVTEPDQLVFEVKKCLLLAEDHYINHRSEFSKQMYSYTDSAAAKRAINRIIELTNK